MDRFCSTNSKSMGCINKYKLVPKIWQPSSIYFNKRGNKTIDQWSAKCGSGAACGSLAPQMPLQHKYLNAGSRRASRAEGIGRLTIEGNAARGRLARFYMPATAHCASQQSVAGSGRSLSCLCVLQGYLLED